MVAFHIRRVDTSCFGNCLGMLILPMVLAYYCECSADTWGSEVGILSTKPYLYFIPSKPVPPGTNGGISALGMCAALCAGLLMSVLYAIMEPSYPPVLFDWCSDV